jgi:hypothetical protein
MHGTHHIRLRPNGERALAALLAMVLLAPAAAAQQGDQSTEFQSFRVPGWSFTPSIALGTVYDTNVALTTPRASLGETQGDSLFTVVPAGQLEFIGKRTDFSLNYRGYLRRYAEIDGLDNYAQRASLHFRRALSRRLSIFAQDSFADSPSTDEVVVNGVPFRRVGSRGNTFAAGADYRLTKFTTLSTRYDMTRVSFDRPDLLLAGGWIQGVQSEVRRQFSPRIAVGGEYGFRTASLDDGARDMRFQDAGGVIHFAVGPHTSGSAAAGFATLQDLSAGVTRRGPYVRLGISHLLESATLGASYQRQYVPSFGFGGASSSHEVGGYVRMPLGRQRLYTQGSVTWRHTMPFETQTLELDTLWLRSTIGWAVTRWSRLEALYTYAVQDSIITGGEIDRHRIGVQFVISEPMRIR